jgi:dihydroceramidase
MSVNWCEEDYVHTPLIAEFYNTISSFSLVLTGFLGLYLNRQPCFLLLIMIGLGSVLFHATLSEETRILDEFSIAAFAVYYVHSVIQLNKLLILLFIAVEVYIGFMHGSCNHWFLMSLAVVGVPHYIATNKLSSDIWRLVLYMGISFCCGLTSWLIDDTMCKHYNFSTHPFWHLFGAIGGYYTCFLFSFQSKKIVKYWYCLPYQH